MAWSMTQQWRLAQEKKILEQKMPGFSFYNLTGNTYVSGSFRTKNRKLYELPGLSFYDLTRDPYVPSWRRTNRSKSYEVRIEIPKGFPDECPRAYITSPNPLWG